MYVYLDQNVMITLAGAMNGSERVREYEGLAQKVLALAENDSIRVPLSFGHVIETQKLSSRRREPVRRFMANLARGNVIAPVYRQEGENLVNYLLRRPTKDLRDQALPHFENEPISLTKDELDLRKRILFYFSLPIPGARYDAGVTSETATNFLEGANTYSKNFLEEFKQRKQQQGLSSLREALLATNLNHALSQKHLTLPERARLKRVAKNHDPEELLVRAPTYHAKFLLEYERLKSGALQRNDYFDILALSTTMPYCDLVVFEKTFTNIAKAAKVPGAKLFPTSNKMKEFEEFISEF